MTSQVTSSSLEKSFFFLPRKASQETKDKKNTNIQDKADRCLTRAVSSGYPFVPPFFYSLINKDPKNVKSSDIASLLRLINLQDICSEDPIKSICSEVALHQWFILDKPATQVIQFVQQTLSNLIEYLLPNEELLQSNENYFSSMSVSQKGPKAIQTFHEWTLQNSESLSKITSLFLFPTMTPKSPSVISTNTYSYPSLASLENVVSLSVRNPTSLNPFVPMRALRWLEVRQVKNYYSIIDSIKYLPIEVLVFIDSTLKVHNWTLEEIRHLVKQDKEHQKQAYSVHTLVLTNCVCTSPEAYAFLSILSPLQQVITDNSTYFLWKNDLQVEKLSLTISARDFVRACYKDEQVNYNYLDITITDCNTKTLPPSFFSVMEIYENIKVQKITPNTFHCICPSRSDIQTLRFAIKNKITFQNVQRALNRKVAVFFFFYVAVVTIFTKYLFNSPTEL